ncbi:hypothetical protein LguiB_006381 [Lonicera macranthoides]
MVEGVVSVESLCEEAQTLNFVDLFCDRLQTYPVTGFGFHEGTNDYKIVRIFYRVQDCIELFGKLAPKVEVYSMRTDSWRSVGVNVPRLLSQTAMLRLPPNYRLGVGERPSVVIMEFKGLVSVCVYELSLRGGDRCSVWVMKDNGDSVSWTKQFKVVFKESGLAVEVHEEWKAYNGRIGQPELS